MGMVTQEAYFRQRVLNYAAKHGVTAAAIRYHMIRKTVHKWKKRKNKPYQRAEYPGQKMQIDVKYQHFHPEAHPA